MVLNARTLHRDGNGSRRILLAIEDVTERRDAEEARRAAEARFTEMVKNVRDHSIFLTDPDGVITSWNVAAERIIGYSEAEAVGKHFSLIFTPEDVAAGLPGQELRQAREQGRAEDERWHRRKDGARFWALGIVTPLHDVQGRLTGFSKILRDMTERKRAEQALRESEERQEFLLRLSDALRPLADPATIKATAARFLGEQLRVNRAFYAEAEDGEWLAVNVVNLYERDVQPQLEGKHPTGPLGRWILDTFRAGQRLVVRDMRADERFDPSQREAHEALRILGSVAVPLVKEGALVAILVVQTAAPRDWQEHEVALVEETAQRIWAAVEWAKAEAALRESEERLRVALAAGDMGTWLYRIPSDEQILDGSMRRLAGLPPEAGTIPLDAFLGAINEEDRDRVRAEFGRCLREGDEIDTEFRVTWPDRSLHWLKDRGKVFAGPDGQPLFMTGAAVDITARKHLEEQLREADRRKDEFLAMLGHELRNPLAPLRGAMETLQRQTRDSDGLGRAYAMMERQVGHLTRLVDDLLDVSRITRGLVEIQKEPVNLAEVADQAVEMATPAVEGRGHGLPLSLPRKPLRVEGDATRLTQVVFNLLNNAAKYTDAGGRIWLTVEREGEQAVVRVRDNGAGMAPDLVPKGSTCSPRGSAPWTGRRAASAWA